MNMDSVTVTERAAQRIGEILGKEAPGTMLRVSVEGGGCSGFQYKFDMDRNQAADDVLIRRDGAAVLIDAVSSYYNGAEFDRAFLQREVQFHKDVIAAINTTLLPAIKNDELKALVVKVAPAFEAHLQMAENLGKQLAGK